MFDDSSQRMFAQHLQIVAIFAPLHAALMQAGCRGVLFKGAALVDAGMDWRKRSMSDADVLLIGDGFGAYRRWPENLHQALVAAGFCWGASSAQPIRARYYQRTYIAASGAALDLHLDVDHHGVWCLDHEEIWARSTSVSGFKKDSSVGLGRACAEDLLLLTAIHPIRGGVGPDREVSDALFLWAQGAMDVPALVARARRWRAGVALGVLAQRSLQREQTQLQAKSVLGALPWFLWLRAMLLERLLATEKTLPRPCLKGPRLWGWRMHTWLLRSFGNDALRGAFWHRIGTRLRWGFDG